jgi:hypothetical protein
VFENNSKSTKGRKTAVWELAKQKWQEKRASPATYIFRIAILVGVTCHFFEIYIWSALKKMAGIGRGCVVDREFRNWE